MNIFKAWCKETSSDPENWTSANPAWGQCAVTALVVQDFYGGLLMRTTVGGISHYFNEFVLLGDDHWTVWDLTSVQFKGAKQLACTTWEVRTREYVLSYPDTVVRYELLKQRLAE